MGNVKTLAFVKAGQRFRFRNRKKIYRMIINAFRYDKEFVFRGYVEYQELRTGKYFNSDNSSLEVILVN